MAQRKADVFYPCPAERVWQVVTDLSHTSWRSDLSRVETLDETHFVEYTKGGLATYFEVTACDPPRLWAFRMENGKLSGSWQGRFEAAAGGARLRCTETVRAKRLWMRPLVPFHLWHQQRRYLADLRAALRR